jgi:hypothetical protein
MMKALIDSRSQENVIAKNYVEQHGFMMKKIPHDIISMNADGTVNKEGSVTHTVDL